MRREGEAAEGKSCFCEMERRGDIETCTQLDQSGEVEVSSHGLIRRGKDRVGVQSTYGRFSLAVEEEETWLHMNQW